MFSKHYRWKKFLLKQTVHILPLCLSEEKQTEYLKKAIAKKWLPKSWLDENAIPLSAYEQASIEYKNEDNLILKAQINTIDELLRKTGKPATAPGDNGNKPN